MLSWREAVEPDAGIDERSGGDVGAQGRWQGAKLNYSGNLLIKFGDKRHRNCYFDQRFTTLGFRCHGAGSRDCRIAARMTDPRKEKINETNLGRSGKVPGMQDV